MKCPNCQHGEFKQVVRKYVLKTRHTEKKEIIIENLPVEECKICGNIILPEQSEKMIEIIRRQIRKEIEQMHRQTASEYPPNHSFSQWLHRLLQKWIG